MWQFNEYIKCILLDPLFQNFESQKLIITYLFFGWTGSLLLCEDFSLTVVSRGYILGCGTSLLIVVASLVVEHRLEV